MGIENANGAGAINTHAAQEKQLDFDFTAILAAFGNSVKASGNGVVPDRRLLSAHHTRIVRFRIPKPGTKSGYGYAYHWVCKCGAKSRRTWRYHELRWPSRFCFSTVIPPKWQRTRVDHTSAGESAWNHVRNVVRGPNRGHVRHPINNPECAAEVRA
jgi:hypothetical protein